MGKPHHFFDEVHALIGELSPGDVIRLQKDTSDTAPYYLVDLIDLEKIKPPLSQPANSLSVSSFGAKGDGSVDDSPALVKCIDAAKREKKSVWIPPGEYMLNGPRIHIGNVRICGAGMWHSSLAGSSPMFEGTGEAVEFSDLGIFGAIDHRKDDSPDNAFNGNFGYGSVFRNLWIEHMKCGFWTTHGTDSMLVEGCRIRNTMADGLNFCDGTSHSVVRNCHLRNTGDDSLATWSPSERPSQEPCIGNSFLHNTIELPWLANGIALYGGSDHLIAENKVEGAVFSGTGILVSSGFKAIPFGGTIRVSNNTIMDAGSDCYIGDTVGGLWIHAKDSDITVPISVFGLLITGSTYSAITVHGPKAVANLCLRDIEIKGAGEYGIDIKPGVSGALRASGLRISDTKLDPIRNGSPEKFHLSVEDPVK